MNTSADSNNEAANSANGSEAAATPSKNQQSPYQSHLTSAPTYKSDPVRNITSTTKILSNDEKIWTAAQQEQYLNMLKQSGFNFMPNNVSTGQVSYQNFAMPFTQQPNMYYYAPEMYGYYPQQWAYLQQMNPYGFVMSPHPSAGTSGATVFNVQQTAESSDSDTLEHLAAQHAAAQLYKKSIEPTETTEKQTMNSEQQTDESSDKNIADTETVQPTEDTQNITSTTCSPTVAAELNEISHVNESSEADENQVLSIDNNNQANKLLEDNPIESANATSTRETSAEVLPGNSPTESHSPSPQNNPTSPSTQPSDYINSSDLIEWASSLLSHPDSDDLKQIREWASVYSYVYHGRAYTDEEAVQLYIYYIQSQPNGSEATNQYNQNETSEEMGISETLTSPPKPPTNPILSMKTHLEAHKKSVEAARLINNTRQLSNDEPPGNTTSPHKPEIHTQHIRDHFHISNRATTPTSKETSYNTTPGNSKFIQISVDTSNQLNTHSNNYTELSVDQEQAKLITSDVETASANSDDMFHYSSRSAMQELDNNNNTEITPDNNFITEDTPEAHHQLTMNCLNGQYNDEEQHPMSLLKYAYISDEEMDEISISYQNEEPPKMAPKIPTHTESTHLTTFINEDNSESTQTSHMMDITPSTPQEIPVITHTPYTITTLTTPLEILESTHTPNIQSISPKQTYTPTPTQSTQPTPTHTIKQTSPTQTYPPTPTLPTPIHTIKPTSPTQTYPPTPTQPTPIHTIQTTQPTPIHTIQTTQPTQSESTHKPLSSPNQTITKNQSTYSTRDKKIHTHLKRDDKYEIDHHKSPQKSHKTSTHKSRRDINGTSTHRNSTNSYEGKSRKQYHSRYSSSDSNSDYISRRTKRNKNSSTHTHKSSSKKKRKKKNSSRHHHKVRDYSYDDTKSQSPPANYSTHSHEEIATDNINIAPPATDVIPTIQMCVSPNMDNTDLSSNSPVKDISNEHIQSTHTQPNFNYFDENSILISAVCLPKLFESALLTFDETNYWNLFEKYEFDKLKEFTLHTWPSNCQSFTDAPPSIQCKNGVTVFGVPDFMDENTLREYIISYIVMFFGFDMTHLLHTISPSTTLDSYYPTPTTYSGKQYNIGCASILAKFVLLHVSTLPIASPLLSGPPALIIRPFRCLLKRAPSIFTPSTQNSTQNNPTHYTHTKIFPKTSPTQYTSTSNTHTPPTTHKISPLTSMVHTTPLTNPTTTTPTTYSTSPTHSSLYSWTSCPKMNWEDTHKKEIYILQHIITNPNNRLPIIASVVLFNELHERGSMSCRSILSIQNHWNTHKIQTELFKTNDINDTLHTPTHTSHNSFFSITLNDHELLNQIAHQITSYTPIIFDIYTSDILFLPTYYEGQDKLMDDCTTSNVSSSIPELSKRRKLADVY